MKKVFKLALSFALILSTFLLSSCLIDIKPVNYQELVNEITFNTMRANVTVIATEKTSPATEKKRSGSGIIFYEDGTSYYLLTNHHVVGKISSTSSMSYSVEDCFENVYPAKLICLDINYDLAVVSFKKDKDLPLSVIEFADSNPRISAKVICLGQPLEQNNAISMGVISLYKKEQIEDSSLSNVDFPVIIHSAPIFSGSSGGALLNTSLKLVGVNYAGCSEKDEFLYGCAIPIEKIIEYLKSVSFYPLPESNH